MTIDKAKWHQSGPDDVSEEQAALHIAVFALWAASRDLLDDEFSESAKQALEHRRVTPATWFNEACCGVLDTGVLTDEGSAFAEAYCRALSTASGYGVDYCAALDIDGEACYDVEDSWTTFERVRPVLDERFDRWRANPTTSTGAPLGASGPPSEPPRVVTVPVRPILLGLIVVGMIALTLAGAWRFAVLGVLAMMVVVMVTE